VPSELSLYAGPQSRRPNVMRYVSSQFTLQIFSQAQVIMKSEAQSRLVRALLPEQRAIFHQFLRKRN